MGLATELAAHAVLASVTGYIIMSAKPGSSLFSWHPTCMAIAFFLFTEGVLLFKKPSPAWRVPVHWAFQAFGLISALVGGTCMFMNKENNNKPHYTTYHGILGAITITYLLIQNSGGALAKYSTALRHKLPVSPGLIRKGHRLSGGVALLALFTTAHLGMHSDWFVSVVENPLLWWALSCSIALPFVVTLQTAYAAGPPVKGKGQGRTKAN